MIIHTPLPPFQQGAVQSVRVRQEEQQGEPQGGDQGKDLAEDIKLFQNDPGKVSEPFFGIPLIC